VHGRDHRLRQLVDREHQLREVVLDEVDRARRATSCASAGVSSSPVMLAPAQKPFPVPGDDDRRTVALVAQVGEHLASSATIAVVNAL
jgi:hypothetical protein